MNKIFSQIYFKLKITSLLNLFFLLAMLFTLNSCGFFKKEPIDIVSNKIKIALRNDNIIDKSEWISLIEYTNQNKDELPNLTSKNDKIDTEKLTDLILSIAKRRRNKENPEIFNPKKENDNKNNNEKAIINIFIENSGSMDGYLKGTTEFEIALSDLFIQVQNKYDKENVTINFINTKIYPAKFKKFNDFIENLEPHKKPYKVGNRSISKLNEILEVILENTNPNSISILMSDCIYSLDKKKDTEDALDSQKVFTKGVFSQKSNEFDFSTIILKMNSKFNGTYYDKNNLKTKLSKNKRPYYFWVIGQDKLIETFQEKIDLTTLKGFENSYYLSNSTENKQPFYTILSSTNKIGKFRPSNRKDKTVKSIESIEYENGEFQFAIAINLDNIPVDETYLLDTENYVIPDGFSIESIEKIEKNKLNKNDYNKISKTKATHFITVQMSKEVEIQDLKLELSNKIPSWVEQSNSIDDSHVKNQLNKTFGFLYLIEGVSEAYTMQNPNNKSYFNINITIKK